MLIPTPEFLDLLRRGFRLATAAALGFAAVNRMEAEGGRGPAVALAESVREVAGAGQADGRPRVVRSALTDSELGATMPFEVALRMRNFGDLQARIARGEVISRAEMAEKYFPLVSDYEAAESWIEGLGLTVTDRYDNHLAFFVQGSVSRIRDAFQVNFARVAYLGREYTSAISAPSVPNDLAPALVGINGLQPHLRMRARHTALKPKETNSFYPPYTPSNLAVAYNATGLSVNGTGETIGLIGYAFPAESDLTLFWQQCGVAQSLGAITDVKVGAGPPSNPTSDDQEEITLDTEWSSSVAPGASVRIYGTADSDQYGDAALQRIISDLSSQPQMHQLSISYGDNEDQYSAGQIQTDSQYFATIAAGGVTIFIASGDGGSRPDPKTGGYNASDPVNVGYPSSDPSVTGVGGTTLVAANPFEPNPGFSETVWFSEGGASGGGASKVFSRPLWQVGEGVPAGSQRLVPDVASSADPDYGGYLVFNGSDSSVGGTSWSSPTWAGYCALFNQARIAAGLGPIGMLNPRIYPLVGSPYFQDITAGNNGDYSATPGYDECTGLGTPNVGALVAVLSISSLATLPPTISVPPAGQSIKEGTSATFTVVATSFSATTYQWQILTPGSAAWTSLSDDSTFSGSATSTLDIADVTTSVAGDEFQCVITNAAGSITTVPVTLSVLPVEPPPGAVTGTVQEAAEGTSVTVGESGNSYSNVPGPITYQWYFNGQPIAGATQSTYLISTASFGDAGEYILAATNPGGTAVASQETLIVTNPPNANAWMDAQQLGTVVYFLYASPAQILRYDLNAGTWLAPVPLSGTPTAFRVAAEGVYVAFGTTTSLYSLDLSTATPLANTYYPTTSIFVNGSYAYLLENNGLQSISTTLERSDGALVETRTEGLFNLNFAQEDVSSALGAVYGESFDTDAELISLSLNSDGTVTFKVKSYPPNIYNPAATRVYVLPGGLEVATNGGAVFNGSTLALMGSFGPAFDDLCLLADGSPVVIRGNEVSLFGAGSFSEAGRTALPGGALRIFANGTTVTGFSPPTVAGGAISVESVTEAQLAASPRQPGPVVAPSAVNFIPDDGFVGADGQIYLLSKLNRSIFVWSPSTGKYAKSIPLLGYPEFVTYSATLNRIYIAYCDQRITMINLGTSDRESPFAAVPTHLIGFAACDSQVYIQEQDAQDSFEMESLFDENGNLFVGEGEEFSSQGVYWDSATQSIYAGPFERVPLQPGSIGTPVYSQGAEDSSPSLAPVRFSPDGSLLVDAQGFVFSATTLNQAGRLGDSFIDAAWLGSTVYTLIFSGSGSSVQEWSGSNYLQTNTANLTGYPLRIWAVPGNQLVALTVVDGTAAMTSLDSGDQAPPPNAPQIETQPQSQTSNTGSTVVFTSGAPGSVSYQWQFNGVNLTDGAGVSGSTGPQLELSGVTSASAGSYTCVVTNPFGSNVTSQANLAVTDSPAPGFLVNISSRAFVGTGGNILIGGFYIGGSTSRSVLIQALGPALAGEGISGVLQHPALTIYDSRGEVIYSNTGWGSSPVLLNAAAAAYAQPVLQADSADSEVLLTLPPGGYTAQISGADGGTGVALCAIYQLP